MLFNSTEFLVFAAVFFGVLPFLRREANARWAFITFASFVFYGWWDWRFLGLIVVSGLIDFCVAPVMVAHPQRRKALLLCSLVANLGILFAFKYSGWLLSTVEGIGAAAGYEWTLVENLPAFVRVLPIGISFYTFQSMSYTIDVYRNRLKPTHNILHFFAYLSMFPQLVAGPIVRASEVMDQLRKPSRIDSARLLAGLRLIVVGFFKKTVIADSLAPFVNSAFSGQLDSMGAISWWAAVSAFACQIYCDFSGYSDIARGLAKWMGLDFGLNFNHPYISTSLREFWSRWHISLSTWFRDYVYVPLGGSRVRPLRAYFNVWCTMLLSGLWHGAAWHFVAWGALHAALLTLERVFRPPDWLARFRLTVVVAFVLTLVQVLVTWVFFRAENIGQAIAVVGTMFNPMAIHRWELRRVTEILPFLAILAAWELKVFSEVKFGLGLSAAWRQRLEPVVLGLFFLACLYFRGSGTEFIYFQF